jgi:ribosomal protein S3
MIPKKTFDFSQTIPLINHHNAKYTTKLEKNLSHFLNSNITSIPFQASSELQDAGYFADELVFLLERRISFRQIKNKLLKQFSLHPYIQGVRITCAGRVGGKSKKAQRSRLDSVKYGQTSLHIFSSRIDFAVRTALTPLGSTGVKVWICYK